MLGHSARNLRTYLGLSPRYIAKLANVSNSTVGLLERELPVRLDDRRKIMAVLYLEKASRSA